MGQTRGFTEKSRYLDGRLKPYFGSLSPSLSFLFFGVFAASSYRCAISIPAFSSPLSWIEIGQCPFRVSP